jgi:sodium/proline symporter
MLAAVLSAIMSTADSQLLVAASAVAHDWNRAGADEPEATVGRSRWVVLVLSLVAVGAALWGNPEIFSKVLFAWTAMGSAFGPLLLVLVVLGPVAPRARLASMLVGFCVAVVAYLVPVTSGTAFERVLPFVLALGVAVWGAHVHKRPQGRARSE